MKVKVKEGVTYGVAGRHGPGTVLDVSEVTYLAFQDKLDIVVPEPEAEPNATPQAIELAKALGIDLASIREGTGKNGRITVGDVKVAEQENG